MTFLVPGSSPRSMHTTRRPAFASKYAAAVPARPAPTTTTSNRSPLITRLAVARSTLQLAELLGERGDNLEHVAEHGVVGRLENLRFRISIDRDDDVRFLHPHEVLNGARDATGNVDARPHRLPGLAHLVGIRDPTRHHRGPRGAN